ncbi:MAG: hypothetical protein KDE19_24635 [Caldilineaceae bacterium]|nr:hypothetical protein [Caldilineaceae bacterium]
MRAHYDFDNLQGRKNPYLRYMSLQHLPKRLPLDDAIRLELVEGVLIFRATSSLQERIQFLLDKQSESPLTEEEREELDAYEELDDYLSLVNRTVRNKWYAQQPQLSSAEQSTQ